MSNYPDGSNTNTAPWNEPEQEELVCEHCSDIAEELLDYNDDEMQVCEDCLWCLTH